MVFRVLSYVRAHVRGTGTKVHQGSPFTRGSEVEAEPVNAVLAAVALESSVDEPGGERFL
jgi:hypothetical protein